MVIRENEPMDLHTTFRTGGKASQFVEVSSVEDIEKIVNQCLLDGREFLCLGNGSNVLVSDAGLDLTVIHIYDSFSKIEVNGNEIYAEAGALLSKVAKVAKDNSLAGFEFASGIPGTIGGAAVMNAGAYGGELKDVCTFVDVLRNGKRERIEGKDMDFGYRHSIVSDENLIVLGVGLKLNPGNQEDIVALMNDFNQRRRDKQPLEFPSAGSTFKRPEGMFAGKLIQDAGLAGRRVGGASVSEKHCGFVVNDQHGTSQDVYNLIQEVIKTVDEEFHVVLEPEVKLLGEF